MTNSYAGLRNAKWLFALRHRFTDMYSRHLQHLARYQDATQSTVVTWRTSRSWCYITFIENTNCTQRNTCKRAGHVCWIMLVIWQKTQHMFSVNDIILQLRFLALLCGCKSIRWLTLPPISMGSTLPGPLAGPAPPGHPN